MYVLLFQYGDADAASFDGGEVYIGGKCGLVPVMAEYYDKSKCPLQCFKLLSSFTLRINQPHVKGYLQEEWKKSQSGLLLTCFICTFAHCNV